MSYPILTSLYSTTRRVRPGLFLGIGLSLAVGALPVAGRAQTPRPAETAPPTATSPSASGGVLGQIGRELSEILLQNRSGVVMIRGHRPITPAMPGGMGTDRTTASGVPSGPPPAMSVIGSGFLVNGNVVVTTAEVAEGIQRPIVISSDNKLLRVTASSVDVSCNLAILIVDGMDAAHALRLGDSEGVLPGMLAVTIGTQAGFRNSGGLAFIAQTGRAAASGEHRYNNLIQFQGAIGPGSSGSPLLGPTGEVIGIVMAAPDMNSGGRGNWPGMGRDQHPDNRGADAGKFDKLHADKGHADKSAQDAGAKVHRSPRMAEMQGAPNGFSDPRNTRPSGPPPFAFGDMPQSGFNSFGGMSSIGFALPINELRSRLPELLKTAQKVPGPVWTGVLVNSGAKPGAYVSNLYEGSPAALAGLEVGDIITHIDGNAIRSRGEFIGWVVQGREGQTIKVQVLRNGVPRIFEVRLRALPKQEELKRMNLRQQAEVGVRVVFYFSCVV